MTRRVVKWAAVALLAAATVGVLAAPAKKPHFEWAGGAVDCDGSLGFKPVAGKARAYQITAVKNVRAKSDEIDLQHADKATAEVTAPTWDFQTIKGEGGVRFAVRQVQKTQTDKVSGECDQVVIYNPGKKVPTGDERILVAELTGSVKLSMLRIDTGANAKPDAAQDQPMVLEGARARVWKTADGLEGTVDGGE